MVEVVVVFMTTPDRDGDEMAVEKPLDVVAGFSVVTVAVATTRDTVSVKVWVDVEEVGFGSCAATKDTGASTSATAVKKLAQRIVTELNCTERRLFDQREWVTKERLRLRLRLRWERVDDQVHERERPVEQLGSLNECEEIRIEWTTTTN